ncbi:MAG: methylmalonyl-CoA mutase family protein [Sphingomonas sp.]
MIVGVNKYRLASEAHLDFLNVDNHAVREAQVARIARVKAGRDEAACRARARCPARGARGSANLLGLAVEAARARATLGEIQARRWRMCSAATTRCRRR